MAKTQLTRKSHKIQRQSIPEALAESLRERILNGELKEGEPLIQEAIAAEYEVSRMPVREAFRQLEASGLITTRIHKGGGGYGFVFGTDPGALRSEGRAGVRAATVGFAPHEGRAPQGG